MKKIIAFVPARGGSRSIKNKNLVKVGGVPLLQHTFKIINGLGNLVHPFISTNDKKIMLFSKSKGFNVDYKRPEFLSKSSSNVVDAILHGLQWFKKKKIYFKTIIILQPTSPIRKIDEVKKALRLFKKKKIKSLVSVTPVREHPFEIVETTNKKWRYLKEPKKNSYRRQNFPKNFYFIDGSFYIIDVKTFLKHKRLVIKNLSKFFLLKRTWPVDIDYYDDLAVCEALLKSNN